MGDFMLARFFIAFSAFAFLWAILEAKTEEKVQEEWVFRGLEQAVSSLESLVQGVQYSSKSNAEEMNHFIMSVLQKEVTASDMTKVLVEYFLASRLKPQESSVEAKLSTLHEMIYLLEEIKKKNDPSLVEKLSTKLRGFRRMMHLDSPVDRKEDKYRAPYKPPRRRNLYSTALTMLLFDPIHVSAY